MRDAIEEPRAGVATERRPGEWTPVEAALPVVDDGRDVEVLATNGEDVFVATYESFGISGRPRWTGYSGWPIITPSHWMPLPSPPGKAVS